MDSELAEVAEEQFTVEPVADPLRAVPMTRGGWVGTGSTPAPLNRSGECARIGGMSLSSDILPADLRQRLEEARLDNLALMRALDRVFPGGPPIPQSLLRVWYVLEADCCEALAVLERPPVRFDLRAMVRDTVASLQKLPAARDRVRAALPPAERRSVCELEAVIHAALPPEQAYDQVPGRDPKALAPQVPVKAARPRTGRNDPCPCGSGKKSKKCCDGASPPARATDRPSFRFEPGSYGGRGHFTPSIRCNREARGTSELHFVLVNPRTAHEVEDDAVAEATTALEGAWGGGAGDPERIALSLREAGYLRLDDPRMAVD